jgi:hypothetical protein
MRYGIVVGRIRGRLMRYIKSGGLSIMGGGTLRVRVFYCMRCIDGVVVDAYDYRHSSMVASRHSPLRRIQ